MTFKMSDTPQTIKIFNLRSDTNEFIGAGDAYIPPHTGLPAVYDTTTGNQVYISAPGPLPENVTSVSPDGEYQKWDGKAWVKDEAAETAARLREAEGTKSRLLQMASEKIAPLQDAVDLDEATDKENLKPIFREGYASRPKITPLLRHWLNCFFFFMILRVCRYCKSRI